ncbi:SRPBCC family protein [Actinomycetospora sp. CA-101289]|uniref:SRPBCC family protein n=1 Tax=Actinomycetospora sp. CA-101289 TaxID=3239893 RepID=UPI003D97263D
MVRLGRLGGVALAPWLVSRSGLSASVISVTVVIRRGRRRRGIEMTDEKQIEVRRVVQAPPDRVFALVSDPKQQQVIDGSGMLQGTTSGPVTAAGQVFTMEMCRDDLGPWRTINTVTEFEPGTVIGWAPDLDRSHECQVAQMLATVTTGGHTYAYGLHGTTEGTEVRLVYDWSGVTDPDFEALCPFVSREQLVNTLDRLADAVRPAAARTSDDS